VAGISIIASFVWMPAYPIWSVTVIAFDMFVIWAVTAHGRDHQALTLTDPGAFPGCPALLRLNPASYRRARSLARRNTPAQPG
jgi:hypothetical protein